MSYSALLIGCGSIGALYDLNKPTKVWTHAKAFSRTPGINFSVFDIDSKLAKAVATKYKVQIADIRNKNFEKFDIVSLATPTPAHYEYLKILLKQNVPLIICEKPVAANLTELNSLSRLYKNASTKIVVNYLRRFHPAYKELQQIIKKLRIKSSCQRITIKYQRGILNNCSHAFDIVEFLFEQPLSFKDFVLRKIKFDAFSYDPTITGSFAFDGCQILIHGMNKAPQSIFEIELLFKTEKILICKSGDEIRFYELDKIRTSLRENKSRRRTELLSHYMLPVIQNALQMLKKKSEPDNFLRSVELNKKIVNLIAAIQK